MTLCLSESRSSLGLMGSFLFADSSRGEECNGGSVFLLSAHPPFTSRRHRLIFEDTYYEPWWAQLRLLSPYVAFIHRWRRIPYMIGRRGYELQQILNMTMMMVQCIRMSMRMSGNGILRMLRRSWRERRCVTMMPSRRQITATHIRIPPTAIR